MEKTEFEKLIEKTIFKFRKGKTSIEIKNDLELSGFTKIQASSISKEAYSRFLKVKGKTKIIRGSIWSTVFLAFSAILFFSSNRYFYLAIFAIFWGIFKIASGISEIKLLKNFQKSEPIL